MLLNPNTAKRRLLTIPFIKSCPFFAGINWINIMEKTADNIPFQTEKIVKKASEYVYFGSWIEYWQ
jgi:hypothetical protein